MEKLILTRGELFGAIGKTLINYALVEKWLEKKVKEAISLKELMIDIRIFKEEINTAIQNNQIRVSRLSLVG